MSRRVNSRSRRGEHEARRTSARETEDYYSKREQRLERSESIVRRNIVFVYVYVYDSRRRVKKKERARERERERSKSERYQRVATARQSLREPPLVAPTCSSAR